MELRVKQTKIPISIINKEKYKIVEGRSVAIGDRDGIQVNPVRLQSLVNLVL